MRLDDLSCDRVYTCRHDVRQREEESRPCGEARLVPRRMEFRQVRHNHR